VKADGLVKLLQEYFPNDPDEIEYKKEILAFIEKHEDCFERSLKVGHITASAWILSCDGEKALLMHHAKLDKWMQLGGHADGDSDVLAVAIKEAQEESGITQIQPISEKIFDIDVHSIPARGTEPEHFHYDIRFLLQVKNVEDVVQNHESKELRWVTKDVSQLPTNSRSILRMVEKWCCLPG
jgi:8-oxo-dGTP pyrophosphatase MutT (NUDIX family)